MAIYTGIISDFLGQPGGYHHGQYTWHERHCLCRADHAAEIHRPGGSFYRSTWRYLALVARRYGEKDRERANRILGQALVLTLGLTAIISMLCVAFADPILHLAGSAPDTHEDAVAYFRIIMGGMVFNVLTMLVNAAQRGVGNTKIAMRTNMVSNAVNVVFGLSAHWRPFWVFPKLGVAGRPSPQCWALYARLSCACFH